MKSKKIMIIEDEEILLKALTVALEQRGYAVCSAGDGQEALEKIFTDKPDLILLDLLLPKMDGATMLKTLRRDSWGRQVPVIVLTNNDKSEALAEALSQGVFEYLIKTNWRLDDVVEKIKSKIGPE